MDPGSYTVEENLVRGFDNAEGSALIVDVCGSIGHDLEESYNKHPNMPSRLICQDLPIVIGQIQKLDGRIESVSYDFYTEQPIKDTCLSSFSTHQIMTNPMRQSLLCACRPPRLAPRNCLQILSSITAAMKPGCSKLLVNKNLIPDTGAH
ncbi:Demethylsterigmatocystin 6-O-methyltransferase-like protein [Emericellopsis cladophorae]|uniref:Demethylsterigmatocystin 6-O-methyltransferase-like protein n=1 Tax=Emericellopsis cladophorae TaxID=2686198 RepID=A0A9P9XW92_9HYPO|nr:Demethylsterigmatocystin 6-O-methyltransferase-like protein [Emericellopsis cladophorae]KAI6778590.1 Demethylsterigmatocystin 6-O-methyltransferase-like protein [Emericellopsis cladophorae]